MKLVNYFLADRVFTNGLGDWDSIPVIPKTQKLVLETALLNIQHYKVEIKGKVEQSRRSALLYTAVLWLMKREPSGDP